MRFDSIKHRAILLIVTLSVVLLFSFRVSAHHDPGHGGSAAPAIVGGTVGAAVTGLVVYLMTSSPGKDKWVRNFRDEDTQRQKDGLRPRSFCRELYQENRSWARKDKECRAKVVSFESGNQLALDNP